jgi:hypothetical protein
MTTIEIIVITTTTTICIIKREHRFPLNPLSEPTVPLRTLPLKEGSKRREGVKGRKRSEASLNNRRFPFKGFKGNLGSLYK